MKYLSVSLAVILMACTVPPNTPIAEAVPAAPKAAESGPVNSKPAVPKPKPIVPRLKAATAAEEAPEETSSDKAVCSSIKTGDVKDDINLKLDCLLSPTDSKGP